MSTLIKLENIVVTRQQKSILEDVSLTINEKEFLTIIGPNGAGKSMLLKCLMGFYKPDSGQVIKRPGLKIGYVPQRLNIDDSIPMSVERFLNLRKTKKNWEQVISQTNVDSLLNMSISALSGGQLQRVLLARALLGQPDLLILDEPAQNLDVSGQLQFYKLLDEIYKQGGIAILMVSHELHLVMASSQKVICLYHHICCSGEPHTVMRDPEFISLFGNDMAKMMAVYNHQHNHSHQHDNEGKLHQHSKDCAHGGQHD